MDPWDSGQVVVEIVGGDDQARTGVRPERAAGALRSSSEVESVGLRFAGQATAWYALSLALPGLALKLSAVQTSRKPS